MKFTDILLDKIQNTLNKIYKLPFIVELSNGSLSKEIFINYLEQDLEYLKDYSKGWLIMASKSVNMNEKKIFSQLSNSINEEIQFHQKYVNEGKKIEQSPTTLLYTSYLLRVAHENSLYESLAAYLSCFWVYEIVGRYIRKNCNFEKNPYKEWIDNYSSDEYSESGVDIMSIMNEYGEKLNETERNLAIEQFVKTTKMEYLFWNSVYKMDSFIIDEIDMKSKPVCVLTIAGSDSGGGAGIQADLNTFHHHKVHGTTVITALTAQNTTGVYHIQKSSSESIEEQLKAIQSDIDIKAIKIGMIFDTDIIETVCKYLTHTKCPIILDPVMISTSGNTLLKQESIKLLCEKLIPLSTLITPNTDETLQILSQIHDNSLNEIKTVDDAKTAAKLISDSFGVQNVLIKGGHLNIEEMVYDVLYEGDDKYSIFKHEYLKNNNTHGSGCALSASIASNLANGMDLVTSVKKSINYIHEAIRNGFKIGKSDYGTLNHFHP